MTERVLGPTGSPRRRRMLLLPLAVVLLIGLFYIPSAIAVHDEGIFQLDGDAVGGAAGGPNDWNNINPPASTTTASQTTFVTDTFNDNSDNILTGGSTKDDLNVSGGPGSGWLCKRGGAVDKNDIEHAFAAAYNKGGDLILYFGADKFSTSGDAQIGFWFFKGDIGCTPSGGGTGEQPFTGAHQVGDVLVLSDFTNGGNVSTIRAFEWVGSGGDTNGTLQQLAVGQDCGPPSPPEPPEICAKVNSGPGTTGGWTYQQKGNLAGTRPGQAPAGQYPAGAFYEGGINLTSFLGADAQCFSTFMAETRQSASVDSVLEDYALGNFDLCDLKISITGTATNEINQQHTYTVNVQQKSAGGGFAPLSGVNPVVTVSPAPGSKTDNCASTGTDASGNCTVVINSTTPGVFTANASLTTTFGGSTFSRDTDPTTAGTPCGGGVSSCGPAVKTYVDANIQINPPTATNAVGTNHTLTGHVNVNPGTGFVNAPDGTTISFAITSGPGSFVGSSSCQTSGGTGSCTVQITSSAAGTTTISASTAVSVAGLTLNRTTNGQGQNSGNAEKTWVDAKISIGPNGTNGITENHTFTGHVDVNPGTGFVNAPNGTTINFSITDGPGSFVGGTSSCQTSGGTGSCSVSITSATEGTTTVNASTSVTVGGQTMNRTTNGSGGNSGPATKVWVDGSLRWLKHDQDGALLGGATFQVCRTHDRFGTDITDECVTVVDNSAPDADSTGGEFQLNALKLGRYTIDETAAPSGYNQDAFVETIELTLPDPDKTATHIWVNVRQYKLIVITCNNATNELVVSQVTLGAGAGSTKDTIGSVPASLSGKQQQDICNMGGASYAPLNAGPHVPNVLIPKP